MHDAVLAGLDGVGIGTSLHFIDPETKLMGALRAEKIADALTARDDAETSPMGRAAILLARTDRMFFEKTLPIELDVARTTLFHAVVARDEKAAEHARLLLTDIEQMPNDGDEPVLQHARRVLRAANVDSILRNQLSTGELSELVKDVKMLIGMGDLSRLADTLAISTKFMQ